MAGFEGVKWASQQMRYSLDDRRFDLLEPDSTVFAVSRSVHYGLFLAFEGIRFFCRKSEAGELEVVFLSLDHNLDRFRRGIAFNLGREQQHMVPTLDELVDVLVGQFFRAPQMRDFFQEMAEIGGQGYLRPFTIDEDQSIGVTFPSKPSIRAVVCRYDRYLGEPFSGVVVPGMVRAVGANGTGCLKLGGNYLMSIKAVDAAKAILPGAACALFLDDQTHLPLEDRVVSEWDTSCCLFALRDGTVVKIPESNLILPSVTIQGITCILREMGVNVVERDMTYGELIRRASAEELVTICSIGTAGILNGCEKLLLVDETGSTLATHLADPEHELYGKLGQARETYWDVYRGKAPVPAGLKLYTYDISSNAPSVAPA